MRLRKKTLTEDEISTVLTDTLRGLEYLHARKKIHRDIKAGNILLNSEGHAKLADFGKIFNSSAIQIVIKTVKMCLRFTRMRSGYLTKMQTIDKICIFNWSQFL